MAMLVPEKARVQAGPVFDSRQHEAGTLKEHFSVSRTSGPGTKGCLIEMLAGSCWLLLVWGFSFEPTPVQSSRADSSRSRRSGVRLVESYPSPSCRVQWGQD